MKDYRELKNKFKEYGLLNDINGILSWDMATMMPTFSRKHRINQINTINENKKRIFDELKKSELFDKIDKEKLSIEDKKNFSLMKKKFDYFDSIPIKIINKKSILEIECEGLWRKARQESSFKVVSKKFSQLVNIVKEESKILSDTWQKSKYDSLVYKYDSSLNYRILKKIFDDLHTFLSKNIEKIIAIQEKENLIEINDKLSEEEQFQISKFFMKKLGFNFKKGRIDKSLHPFCGGSTEDIRITTRFTESDSFSCFDALMHETGHALYEQGLPKHWFYQPLGQAGGMSFHESQSLFIEMQLIKSINSSKFIEDYVKKKFNRHEACWNSENIYKSRTKVKKNFIRVDADEVQYPLHIIHRFNIEYEIIEKDESVECLPDIWNHNFKKIFNFNVTNDNVGCLQDIHWYHGDFGYFPTYTIGALIAAQLRYTIEKKNSNFRTLLEFGEFNQITNWLKKNFHNKGSLFKLNELMENITGDKLNTKFFKNHIIERYIERKF